MFFSIHKKTPIRYCISVRMSVIKRNRKWQSSSLMLLLLLLAFGAVPEEIHLLRDDAVPRHRRNILVQCRKRRNWDVCHPVTGHTADVGMRRYIRIVTKCLLAHIQLADNADLAERVEGL